jgi:hypothetical protein
LYIIEDTGQKKGQHATKNEWFSTMHIPVIRNKLPFGDYALPPKVAVDTKKDMDEIAKNICGPKTEHIRFKNECINARDAGCKLYFLIENILGIKSIDEVHTWVNPRCITNPNCVQGPRLEKAMKTMQERYDCTFLFCDPAESAEIIIRLLTGGD